MNWVHLLFYRHTFCLPRAPQYCSILTKLVDKSKIARDFQLYFYGNPQTSTCAEPTKLLFDTDGSLLWTSPFHTSSSFLLDLPSLGLRLHLRVRRRPESSGANLPRSRRQEPRLYLRVGDAASRLWRRRWGSPPGLLRHGAPGGRLAESGEAKFHRFRPVSSKLDLDARKTQRSGLLLDCRRSLGG